jgi:hypothetical protein
LEIFKTFPSFSQVPVFKNSKQKFYEKIKTIQDQKLATNQAAGNQVLQ